MLFSYYFRVIFIFCVAFTYCHCKAIPDESESTSETPPSSLFNEENANKVKEQFSNLKGKLKEGFAVFKKQVSDLGDKIDEFFKEDNSTNTPASSRRKRSVVLVKRDTPITDLPPVEPDQLDHVHNESCGHLGDKIKAGLSKAKNKIKEGFNFVKGKVSDFTQKVKDKFKDSDEIDNSNKLDTGKSIDSVSPSNTYTYPPSKRYTPGMGLVYDPHSTVTSDYYTITNGPTVYTPDSVNNYNGNSLDQNENIGMGLPNLGSNDNIFFTSNSDTNNSPNLGSNSQQDNYYSTLGSALQEFEAAIDPRMRINNNKRS